MPDFILFMHGDTTREEAGWPAYFAKLRELGCFEGGSSIGGGACFNKQRAAPAIAAQLTGFIRVQAADLAAAQRLLDGNPVYEAGGTVEIRELPRD